VKARRTARCIRNDGEHQYVPFPTHSFSAGDNYWPFVMLQFHVPEIGHFHVPWPLFVGVVANSCSQVGITAS
jgi:hypothetical protein